MSNIKWPNFFIAGVPKAGTTSLYEYLKKAPQIYMSPVKEPHYFPTAPTHSQPRYSKDKYLDLFQKVKNQKIIGEASPGYFFSLYTPKLIHEVSPNSKILICLRDPVERIYSAYLMFKNTNQPELPTFKNWVDELIKSETDIKQPSRELFLGLYSEPLQRYWQTFGKNQIKIIIFEEFIKDPKTTISKILEFLGLGKEIFDFHIDKHNSLSGPRGLLGKKIMSNKEIKSMGKVIPSPIQQILLKVFTTKLEKPIMDEHGRKSLINYYRQDVIKTENLLERKLPWDNFSDNN